MEELELELTVSMMKKLSVQQLGDYLTKSGISPEAIKSFLVNQVTGQALLLLDDSELKELIQTIGDRAILRNLLKEVKVSLLWLPQI